MYVAKANPGGRKICRCTSGVVTVPTEMLHQEHEVEDDLKNGSRDITSGRLAFCSSKDYETIGKPLPERHPQSNFIFEKMWFGVISETNQLNLNQKCLLGE